MSSYVSARERASAQKGARRLKQARDAMYRKHVLETAERIFADKGEANTKMQDVAAAAAISLSTLYAAFPSKGELYQAILAARGDELLARVAETVQGLLAEGATPLGLVLQGMDTHLRFFMEHTAFLKMNLHEGHVWYHHASRPSREQEDHWARGERLLEVGFGLCEDAGLLVPQPRATQARTMVVLQQVRLANWVLMGMRESQDELVASIQADFVRTFCRPAIACRVLSDDGSRLRADALTLDLQRASPVRGRKGRG